MGNPASEGGTRGLSRSVRQQWWSLCCVRRARRPGEVPPDERRCLARGPPLPEALGALVEQLAGAPGPRWAVCQQQPVAYRFGESAPPRQEHREECRSGLLSLASRESGASGKYASVNMAELSGELTDDGYGRAHLYLAGGDANGSVHRRNRPEGGRSGTARRTWVSAAHSASATPYTPGAWRVAAPSPTALSANGHAPTAASAVSTSSSPVRPRAHHPPPARRSFLPSTPSTRPTGRPRRFTGSDWTDLDYSGHRAVGARFHY